MMLGITRRSAVLGAVARLSEEEILGLLATGLNRTSFCTWEDALDTVVNFDYPSHL